jgi:hypothetical protein
MLHDSHNAASPVSGPTKPKVKAKPSSANATISVNVQRQIHDDSLTNVVFTVLFT